MDMNISERVTRLEEAQAFGERTAEQLHEEILTLVRRVDSLTARLAKAESALTERPAGPGVEGAESADGKLEVPPHSHMPLDKQAGRTTDPFGPTGAPPDSVR
jgi:uncharacterized coiled-coil protein SlyX